MVVDADGNPLNSTEPKLVIDSTSFILPTKHYYQVETPKTQIVLHFTVSDEAATRNPASRKFRNAYSCVGSGPPSRHALM